MKRPSERTEDSETLSEGVEQHSLQTKKHDEMMMMMMMMIMMRVDRQVKAHVIMVLCESSVASQVSVET